MYLYIYIILSDMLVTPTVDLCSEAGTSVNGGQTVINPWVIIGGVASAVCNKSEFIM